MTFSWLPKVETCCFCVKSLVLAGYLIAAYTIITCISRWWTLIPMCDSMFVGPVGVAAVAFAYTTFGWGLLVVAASVFLMVTLFKNMPNGDFYVVSIIMSFPIAMTYQILCVARMSQLGGQCPGYADELRKMNYTEEYIKVMTEYMEIHPTGMLVGEVLQCLIFFYFAIVVNSIAVPTQSIVPDNVVKDSLPLPREGAVKSTIADTPTRRAANIADTPTRRAENIADTPTRRAANC